MKWDNVRNFILFILVIILLTGAESCCPKDTDRLINEALINENLNRNTNTNTNTSTNQAPTVSDITYRQLHLRYEDLPHKYELTAVASDNDSETLLYQWQADCGYFPTGNQTENPADWWYDTAGECLNATITVHVSDGIDETAFSKKIFEE